MQLTHQIQLECKQKKLTNEPRSINPFTSGKLKNSIFGMPIISSTLNISNLRATSAKSINLHTIRKLIEYSLKNTL